MKQVSRFNERKGATGAYTQIATPGANTTTYTDNDTTLLDGTQYYYKVCANNSAGDSPFSNEVNGITTLSAPTSLTATAVSSSQINLTWTDNSASESWLLKSSKALLIIYTTLKLRSLPRMQPPTVLQVSVQEPNITIECELTMRLRLPHIAVRRTPPLFLVFPSHHQDSRSPPFCQAKSLSPGLTTLTMKRVSRFSERKVLRAHIQLTTTGANATTYSDTECYRWYFVLLPGFCLPTPLETLPIRMK